MNQTALMDFPAPSQTVVAVDALSIREIRGRAEVLAHLGVLADLAARSGQRGAVDHLAFRFSDPYFGAKRPCLFLLYADAGTTSRDEPVAAVLLNEYRVFNRSLRVFVPADLEADWAVLGPPELRASAVSIVASGLLRSGALLVLVALAERIDLAKPVIHPGLPEPLARVEQPLLRTLALRDTLEATLASMGSHTRRNLRLSSRKAVQKRGARFIPMAELPEAEFLLLNRRGFYPVPDGVASWRYRSARENEGGFLAGVQAADGEWLALLGGRRYAVEEGRCTAVDWQWNPVSQARLSPGSLMRLLLFEHERAAGVARLRFEGGTPHSMRSAFLPETVTNLLFRDPTVPRAFIRLIGHFLRRGNVLRDFLASPHLTWYRR